MKEINEQRKSKSDYFSHTYRGKHEKCKITIDRAIEWIDNRMMFGRYNKPIDDDYVYDECHEAGRIAINALLERKGWTPISEKMPPECQDVLLYIERDAFNEKGKFRKETINIGHRYKDFYDCDGCSGVKAFAWMPLPDPYKEEN